MTEKFTDYFEETVEYPKGVLVNLLPMGVCWDYISNTFLDGFINYVEILDAFLMPRYTNWEEPYEVGEMTMEKYREPPEAGGEWVAPQHQQFKNKKEVFEHYTQEGRLFHTRIGVLDDDVIILARAKTDDPSQVVYVYFWFDCDNSDCCIGRFQTEDRESLVRGLFEEHLSELAFVKRQKEPVVRIPNHFFTGWIHW